MSADRPTARIRELNDALRKTSIGGRVLITQGINALPRAVVNAISETVAKFSDFTPDNDPRGEHDFGSFDVVIDRHAHRIMWKIDYYDPEFEGGSEDPSDPEKTGRVLTIMLAEEY